MNYTVKTLAKEIKGAVKWLKSEDRGCCTFKLNGRLAVCVGWSDGFDSDDKTCIHSKSEPSWCVVVGLKVWTSDSLRTDFDWISYPYYESGDIEDVGQSVEPNENYDALAEWLLDKFNYLKEFDITEEGEVLPKEATIELSELDCYLNDEEGIKNAAIDYLSDEVGYCIESVEDISLEDEGLVHITGIVWDTED